MVVTVHMNHSRIPTKLFLGLYYYHLTCYLTSKVQGRISWSEMRYLSRDYTFSISFPPRLLVEVRASVRRHSCSVLIVHKTSGPNSEVLGL